MGLPAMSIIFTAAAKDSIRRSDRGAVGMIVHDTVPETNPVVVYKEKDILETLSADTKEQIQLALKGNVYAPSKIVVYVIAEDATDYTEALKYFAINKINWLCCPSVATDKVQESVVTWVKTQRTKRNKVKAVLPAAEADCEGIVNFANASIPADGKTYTTEKFCSRIAGLLAGTPSKYGATYAVLDEVSTFHDMDDAELDTAIEAGKFVIFYDGEKAKVARAVNSLKTVTEGKTEAWKKIKVVETMDMIHDDLVLLAEDNYIGKYANTYNNKCLLVTAIKSYLDEIGRSGLIQDYSVDFDVDAIRDYIIDNKSVSRDAAEAMTDMEIKKQYTDEKVFLKAYVTIVDVMEDITLQIEV